MRPISSNVQFRLLLDHLPRLRTYVGRLVGDRERVDEVLQDVCLRVLVTRAPIDLDRFYAWARGIVRHVVAHEWRERRRALAEQPLREDSAEDTFEVPSDPEGRLDAQAAIARIADTIDQEDLALLFRRYVLRETGRQLADESTKSPAAVRMRLMRLRAAVSAHAL